MSYFGGLIGVVITSFIFTRKRKIDFLKLADFIIPAIPLGYFFGRLGNFINGELYGRPTESVLGMLFSSDQSGLLRHPSQLYEAFFEGLILFIISFLFSSLSCSMIDPCYNKESFLIHLDDIISEVKENGEKYSNEEWQEMLSVVIDSKSR